MRCDQVFWRSICAWQQNHWLLTTAWPSWDWECRTGCVSLIGYTVSPLEKPWCDHGLMVTPKYQTCSPGRSGDVGQDLKSLTLRQIIWADWRSLHPPSDCADAPAEWSQLNVHQWFLNIECCIKITWLWLGTIWIKSDLIWLEICPSPAYLQGLVSSALLFLSLTVKVY